MYDDFNHFLIVTIKDSGIGICKEDVPKLFDQFGRLKRIAEINSAGIGLGLFFVKKIVEKFNGSIVAQSPGVGRGTTFAFKMKISPVQDSSYQSQITTNPNSKILLGPRNMLEDKQQNQTDNKSEQINTEENTLRESYFQEADARLSDSYCALSK